MVVKPEQALLPARSLAVDVSLKSIAILLLRRRWLTICSTILCFVIFAGINYTPGKWYSSSATFSPKRRPASSAASSLLAQFGLGAASSSADGYLVELVKSRAVLGPVVESHYKFQSDTGTVSGTLAEIYGIRNRPKPITRRLAIGNLSYKVKSAPQGPYLVKVTVETPYAELSPLVATQIITELNRVNMESRRALAAKEKEFIEERMLDAGISLRAAEDQMLSFDTRNRSFITTSPVAFERDRLKRQLAMRQDLYTSLAKALDKARIAEVQETPLLSLVERPEVPFFAERPEWIAKAILGAFFGFFLGILLSFFHAYFAGETYPFTVGAADYIKLRGAVFTDVRRFISSILGRALVRRRPAT